MKAPRRNELAPRDLPVPAERAFGEHKLARSSVGLEQWTSNPQVAGSTPAEPTNAVGAMDRSRSRSIHTLGTSQAAGTGCSSFFIARRSARPAPPASRRESEARQAIQPNRDDRREHGLSASRTTP